MTGSPRQARVVEATCCGFPFRTRRITVVLHGRTVWTHGDVVAARGCAGDPSTIATRVDERHRAIHASTHAPSRPLGRDRQQGETACCHGFDASDDVIVIGGEVHMRAEIAVRREVGTRRAELERCIDRRTATAASALTQCTTVGSWMPSPQRSCRFCSSSPEGRSSVADSSGTRRSGPACPG